MQNHFYVSIYLFGKTQNDQKHDSNLGNVKSDHISDVTNNFLVKQWLMIFVF